MGVTKALDIELKAMSGKKKVAPNKTNNLFDELTFFAQLERYDNNCLCLEN